MRQFESSLRINSTCRERNMGRDSHFSDVLASPKVTGFLVWTDLVRGSRGWVGHGSVQREHHEEGSKRRNHWTCDISFFLFTKY
jgi:hypothetical protein